MNQVVRIGDPDRRWALGIEEVRRYCQARNRDRDFGQDTLSIATRGHSITISQRWHDRGRDFSMRLAQLRYDPVERRWSLYWADRNECWQPFGPETPSKANVKPLLDEITADPWGAFWG